MSLALKKQSVFALLGPNGAGKSSLFRVFAGDQRPDSGHATIFGLDCAEDKVTGATFILSFFAMLSSFSNQTAKDSRARFVHGAGGRVAGSVDCDAIFEDYL